MSEHLSIEQLLDYRDGEMTQRARDHLSQCASCARELERLYQVRSQLRALPSGSPPRGLWQHTRVAIRRERRLARRSAMRRVLLAAASVAILLLVGRTWLEVAERGREAARLGGQIADLKERSQLLDAELRALRHEPTEGWRAAALIPIEDDLEQVDRAIADVAAEPSDDQLSLWALRLELQSAMLRVHLTPVRLEAL